MRKFTLSLFCILLCCLSFAQDEQPTGHHSQTVAIDGLQYYLNHEGHTAMVANGNSWEGELEIPETVEYEGEAYTVEIIEWLAFDGCKTLTKVRIPKTVLKINHYADWEDCQNPFVGCTGLKRIEVDEENPNFCAVDGVLFSKDKAQLCCYPAGARRESYDVPDGVIWIGGDAFAYNPYLVKVTMPNSVTHSSFGLFSYCKSLESIRLSESIKHIAAGTFSNCESLLFLDIPKSVNSFSESVFSQSPIKTLIIRGTFPQGLRDDTFYCMDDEVVIYVQPSEIEKFKKVFSGIVLPIDMYNEKCATPTIAYDNGRLVFSCETQGAEYVYEIKCMDNGSGRGGEVSLSQTYEIRVRASLDGYEDSDEAVATIGWRNGRPVMEGFSSITLDDSDGNADVNADGKVDVADISAVISYMAGQPSE